MRRFFAVFISFCFLAVALCVPAAADDSEIFSISQVQTYSQVQKNWTSRDFSWTSSAGSYLLTVPNPTTSSNYDGLRFSMVAPGYVRVNDGYVFVLNISFIDSTMLLDSAPTTDDFSIVVTTENGTYSFAPSSIQMNGNVWTVSFSQQIGDGLATRLKDIQFTTYMPSYLSQAYTVLVSTSLTTTPTAEYKRHLELLEKLQEFFGNLSSDIDKQTDELTNGWENNGDDPADVGGAADNLGQAESDALGGKSDAEIRDEVNDALSGDGLPDFETSFVIANLFDRLLSCFGTGYQSLLILSLTLGLAAFLIGRSWSKG